MQVNMRYIYSTFMCKQKVELNTGLAAWLDWSEWSRCSVSCGEGGRAFRSRSCLTDDPQVECEGQGTEFMTCSPYSCPLKTDKVRFFTRMKNVSLCNDQCWAGQLAG